jgi:signal transduction histidine kinase
MYSPDHKTDLLGHTRRVTSSSTDLMGPAPSVIDTLQRVLVVARWLCWTWMVAVVGFSGKALIRPVTAWIAVAMLLGITVLTTYLVRHDPEQLRHPRFVACEAVAAICVAIADGWVFEAGHVFATSQDLSTEWALVVAVSAGIAAGPVVAGILGSLFGPARLLSAALNDFSQFGRRHLVAAFATTLFYGAAGALFGWLVTLLRRSEREISHHRARDEMARMLHDTVLQTLALVDRRTQTTDPQLAATARQADRDLRAFLFSDASSGTESLATRIAAQVDRVGRDSDVRIVVNVLDDDCRLEPHDQDVLARAIGQSVANALEHAHATQIVVFAEADEDGHVFASVRDDGQGFDPANLAAAPGAATHGIRESIIARIESIGGRAKIVSSPGHGTEVSLWTK